VRPDGRRQRGGRTSSVVLNKGDIVRIVTGNGGGWGDPLHRDAAAIARDLADELISRSDIAAHYSGGAVQE